MLWTMLLTSLPRCFSAAMACAKVRGLVDPSVQQYFKGAQSGTFFWNPPGDVRIRSHAWTAVDVVGSKRRNVLQELMGRVGVNCCCSRTFLFSISVMMS